MHFLLDAVVTLGGLPQLLALGQEDDVDDHVGEVMGKVAGTQPAHDPPEHLVGLFGKGTLLKPGAVQLLQVDLHRVVQLVQVAHGDVDAEVVEHVVDFGARQASRVVGVELCEYFLDGGLLDQLLGKVQVVVVLAVLVAEPTPDPLDEGGVAQLGAGCQAVLLFHFYYIEMEYWEG